MKLGVNIDHIAVLREARKINDPLPLDAVNICQLAKADQITIHLREDRRHIVDEDVKNIINLSKLPINLECSIDDKIIDIVCKLKPFRVTLVPENRQEVTTEGGLNLEKNFQKIKKTIKRLQENEIEVSLFIDPNLKTIKLSKKLKAQWIELHTGTFANIYAMLYGGLDKTHHSIKSLQLSRDELKKRLKLSIKDIKKSAKLASKLNLNVAIGHGLNYQNVTLLTDIKYIQELNIGQSIIARSIFTGLKKAIKDMKKLCKK
jgi:pyridoxine 5-phosphate synthase